VVAGLARIYAAQLIGLLLRRTAMNTTGTVLVASWMILRLVVDEARITSGPKKAGFQIKNREILQKNRERRSRTNAQLVSGYINLADFL